MPESPLPLAIPPGIRRDGAYLEGALLCQDGQWVRFDRNAPRKMAGYRRLTDQIPGMTRGMYVDDFAAGVNTYLGQDAALLEVAYPFGGAPAVSYRTPTGLVPTPGSTLWQFDQLFDAASGQSLILAHPGQNLTNINSNVAAPVYAGNAATTDAFAILGGATPPPAVDGGIVVLHPYVFFFGSDGFITWSVPNTPGDVSITPGGGGTAGLRATTSKIVRGLVYRGGSANSPAGLFWSVNSLLRASFIGGAPVFRFDTISDQTTILSSRTPIEYDGLYYWVGLDRFLVYTGTVQEVPNNYCLDWFFDNLNPTQHQKVFSFKVPRRGEIWFCFPFGTATECSHAVVYNVRNRAWYDTVLPNGGRSDGRLAETFGYPFLAGAQPTAQGTYKLWQHETGQDEVDGAATNAIRSYFTTGQISVPASAGRTKDLQAVMLELDLRQTGPMSVTLAGQNATRGGQVLGDTKVFQPEDEVVRFKDARRFLQLTFESNVAGGDYLMGMPYLHVRETGGRVTT